MAPSLADLRRDCPDLPPVPVHVLTAGGAGGVNAKSDTGRVHDAWQATVARAPSARYTNIAASGHFLPIDAPDSVIEVILGVLDAVPKKSPAGRRSDTDEEL